MNVDPDLARARDVLERHKHELMRRYGAVGIGIGAAESGDGHALVLYLESAPAKPHQSTYVEGIPLRFRVTGGFKLLG